MVHVNVKNKKNASVQLNYIIHIEEIKPWPPSQSLSHVATTVPCIAAPPIYLPSSSASVAATIGELGNQLRRSGSSVLRKAYTSDDELDELKSPLASIFPELMPCSSSSPAAWKLKEGQNPVRYDLLREIWKNS
ncbi:unnamed protein product [Linum trigynum]|uniref:Uncharacterized protein n=1 Tax=Linum trigynum TaxID=586398 RepID=A0AAV2FDD4_9ROSI